MSQRAMILEAMESLLRKCGTLEGLGYSMSLSGYPATTLLHLHKEALTPHMRNSLILELGQPKREEWDKKNAYWQSEGYKIVAYGWPWLTCDSCGQPVGTEVSSPF